MMGKHMGMCAKISLLLIVVGGLNWGLVSIDPSWNLVEMLFGSWPMVVRIVYALVGISALVVAAHHMGMCGHCKKMGMDCKDGSCDTHGAPKA